MYHNTHHVAPGHRFIEHCRFLKSKAIVVALAAEFAAALITAAAATTTVPGAYYLWSGLT